MNGWEFKPNRLLLLESLMGASWVLSSVTSSTGHGVSFAIIEEMASGKLVSQNIRSPYGLQRYHLSIHNSFYGWLKFQLSPDFTKVRLCAK